MFVEYKQKGFIQKFNQELTTKFPKCIVPVANRLRLFCTYIAVTVTESIILVTFILLNSDIQQYKLIICLV